MSMPTEPRTCARNDKWRLIEPPRSRYGLRPDWNLSGKTTVTFMRLEVTRATLIPPAPPQHAAQPCPGGADAAQGGDGGAQEGQRPARPRAQPLEAELRGAQEAARPGPEGAGRPTAAATAGATKSMSTHTSTHRETQWPDVRRARIASSGKADEEQMVVGCHRNFWQNCFTKVQKNKFKIPFIH